MNSSKSAKKRQIYLRVYHHEISRRRQIAAEEPKAYTKLFRANNKGLSEECCEKHIWVPMTTLWIHDKVGRGYTLYGYRRRGFAEAHSFIDGLYRVTPQMCWRCASTRELITEIMTWTERHNSLTQRLIEEAKGKPRGRQGADIMLHDFDELFDNSIEYATT